MEFRDVLMVVRQTSFEVFSFVWPLFPQLMLNVFIYLGTERRDCLITPLMLKFCDMRPSCLTQVPIMHL